MNGRNFEISSHGAVGENTRFWLVGYLCGYKDLDSKLYFSAAIIVCLFVYLVYLQ